MTFLNIFENITRNNVIYLNDRNIFNTEHTAIIIGSCEGKTMRF